jgi:hypothetical protein
VWSRSIEDERDERDVRIGARWSESASEVVRCERKRGYEEAISARSCLVTSSCIVSQSGLYVLEQYMTTYDPLIQLGQLGTNISPARHVVLLDRRLRLDRVIWPVRLPRQDRIGVAIDVKVVRQECRLIWLSGVKVGLGDKCTHLCSCPPWLAHGNEGMRTTEMPRLYASPAQRRSTRCQVPGGTSRTLPDLVSVDPAL